MATIITDDGRPIIQQTANSWLLANGEWADLFCILSTPLDISDSTHDTRTGELLIRFDHNSTKVKVELMAKCSVNDIVTEGKHCYIFVGDQHTDLIRVTDQQTGSIITGQKTADGRWMIRLWESAGTKPGSIFYASFFRGLGIIPPDMPWESYDWFERMCLDGSVDDYEGPING